MFKDIHFEGIRHQKKLTRKNMPKYFIDNEAGIVFIPWFWYVEDNVTVNAVYKKKYLA